MLMLLCLFKLIIKDRATPPHLTQQRIYLCSDLPGKVMMNYPVYLAGPIKEPADSPIFNLKLFGSR